HSTTGTVMYGTYSGVKSGLSADDVAGIQELYGPRQPDAYDASAANDTLDAASPLSLADGRAHFRAELTSQADVDYYRVIAPASATSQIDLTWLDNSTNETGFRIEQSLDGTNYTLVGTVAAGETRYAVTGLSVDTAYQFRVCAAGAEVDSPWSAAVDAVPQAAT